MGRNYGFQQHHSSYAVHKESRQQQSSYSMHEETRNYSNSFDHQNHIATAMQIVPSLGIMDSHSQKALRHQSKFHDGGFAVGREYGFAGGKMTPMPFAAGFEGSALASAQFSKSGFLAADHTAMGNAEFGAFEEVIGPPAGTVTMQEMRYERSSWGGGGGRNRNGYSRVEWISKGI